METAIFVGKFNCKLLKGDSRRLSAFPASIAVNMPFRCFTDKDSIYLLMGCSADTQSRILDLLVFCRTLGVTAIFIFDVPPTDVSAILERGVMLYMTKQPRWFLKNLSRRLNSTQFKTANTVIRYDKLSDTVTSMEL